MAKAHGATQFGLRRRLPRNASVNRPPRKITFRSEGRGRSPGTSAGNTTSVFCGLGAMFKGYINGHGYF